MLTVLITGAGGNIGVSMTRALKEWDRPVRVIGTEASDYYGYLSEADTTYEVPFASDNAYLDRLEDVIERESVDVALPSNGWEVNALSEHGSTLAASTALPDHDAVETFQNKWRFYEELRQTDVPTPRTTLVETRAQVIDAVESIPTDEVWVRGVGIKDLPGRKMADPETISDWIDYHDVWGECTVSTYLGGSDLTWLGVFDRGSLVCSQGRERLDYGESRSWGTGAPTVSRTIHREDVNRLGRRAIDAVDGKPHGVYFTDMREDGDGTPRVTEVNPGRLGTTSSEFYRRAGLNVTSLLVEIALGDDYDAPPTYDAISADLHYISKASCESVIVPGSNMDDDGF